MVVGLSDWEDYNGNRARVCRSSMDGRPRFAARESRVAVGNDKFGNDTKRFLLFHCSLQNRYSRFCWLLKFRRNGMR